MPKLSLRTRSNLSEFSGLNCLISAIKKGEILFTFNLDPPIRLQTAVVGMPVVGFRIRKTVLPTRAKITPGAIVRDEKRIPSESLFSNWGA